MATQIYTDGLQTMKEVIKKSLAQARKPRSYYKPFYELAIDGYRTLRLHHTNEGKQWYKLIPDSLQQAGFPPDFEDLIGLYVPNGGELFPLTRKDSIILTTTTVGITETHDAAKGEGSSVLSPINSGPYTQGGINVEGYYSVDWDGRKFNFRNLNTSEVILLYRTSGTMIGSQTWIPNRYIPVLIAYIVYEYYKFDDKYPQSRRQELLQQYNTEIIKLADLESPSLEEYMDAIRSTYYTTPKRY